VKRRHNANRQAPGVHHGQAPGRTGQHVAQGRGQKCGVRGNRHRLHDIAHGEMGGLVHVAGQDPGQAPGGDHAQRTAVVKDQGLAGSGFKQGLGRTGGRGPKPQAQRSGGWQFADGNTVQAGGGGLHGDAHPQGAHSPTLVAAKAPGRRPGLPRRPTARRLARQHLPDRPVRQVRLSRANAAMVRKAAFRLRHG
jgi:hypothetical protein